MRPPGWAAGAASSSAAHGDRLLDDLDASGVHREPELLAQHPVDAGRDRDLVGTRCQLQAQGSGTVRTLVGLEVGSGDTPGTARSASSSVASVLTSMRPSRRPSCAGRRRAASCLVGLVAPHPCIGTGDPVLNWPYSRVGSGAMAVAGDAPADRPQGPSAPRGRLSRTERRSQLLDAAREVFVASGYHAAAMDAIATRAGISKPVLYQHFPGKLELYLALLDAGIESLEAAVREALASTTDNHERVNATIGAYFAFVADPDSTFRLVFESDLTGEPAVRERVDAVDARVHGGRHRRHRRGHRARPGGGHAARRRADRVGPGGGSLVAHAGRLAAARSRRRAGGVAGVAWHRRVPSRRRGARRLA